MLIRNQIIVPSMTVELSSWCSAPKWCMMTYRSGIRIILYALRHWSPQPVVWNGRVWRVHSNGRWPEDSFSSVLFFSSVLIVNKWSVMFSRCTTTFHSDGLVNWLHEYDFWIGFNSIRHFISSRGGFSWRLFWQTLQRSRSAGPWMLLLVRYWQCTSKPKT